jgi:hypothetical protein
VKNLGWFPRHAKMRLSLMDDLLQEKSSHTINLILLISFELVYAKNVICIMLENSPCAPFKCSISEDAWLYRAYASDIWCVCSESRVANIQQGFKTHMIFSLDIIVFYWYMRCLITHYFMMGSAWYRRMMLRSRQSTTLQRCLLSMHPSYSNNKNHCFLC